MAEPALRRLSYLEYLEVEATAEVRHEYVDGELYAMSGGTPAHALLAANTIFELRVAHRGGPCAPYTSDLRVYVEAEHRAAYPDVTVLCGPPVHAPADPDAVTNPTVLVAVLSDSTERCDRGEKFRVYRQLPTLRDYVLVSQTEPYLEHFARNDDASWTLRTAGPGEAVTLSTGAVLAVDALYAGVTLSPKTR